MHDQSTERSRLRNQTFPGQWAISAQPHPDPLLTAREAAAYRRQGLSTFWRQVKLGQVPAPIYITARSPRWYLSDLCPTRAQGGAA